MEPCSLEEIQAMSGPNATFSYAVFGGSARMARQMNTTVTWSGSAQTLEVVEHELVEYFAGSKYATNTALFRQAALLISRMIAITALAAGQTVESQAAAVKHNLFLHTYIDQVEGGTVTRVSFASTFMGILAGTLAEREGLQILKQLHRVVLSPRPQNPLWEVQEGRPVAPYSSPPCAAEKGYPT